MNPEFRYRAPPPSYAAAMQDYQNELRDLGSIPYVPGSPPPSYKSHTTIERPGIHIIFPRNEDSPTSNPPTYRLRNTLPRPSLAILNDSNLNTDSQPITTRFSVSSTTTLVTAEQQPDETQTDNGIINLSFSGGDHTVEMYNQDITSTNNTASRATATTTTTTDGSVQTDTIYPQDLPRSVAIILEDGDASTL